MFKKAQTLQETLQNIKAGQLFYPETMDSDLKNLLSNILNLNIKDRFSMDEILNHQFFNDKVDMKNCQSTKPSKFRFLIIKFWDFFMSSRKGKFKPREIYSQKAKKKKLMF